MPSVFVRTLTGATLTAEQEGTVGSLKVSLEARGCVAAEEQRLSCNGHILEDAELLDELSAQVLNLDVDVLGGGKKRKKKTYTKPKKIKSKHKKVKLAVLKYYRVDQSSGKVTRLRKECPAECGAGTFMAMHFNRHYCGKCHLTYMLENPGRDPALDKKKEVVVVVDTKAPAKGGKKKK